MTTDTPATKTGDQIVAGDVFKDRGRWYTATGDPTVPNIGGRPYDRAREVPVGDPMPDGYGPPTVLVFDDTVYQLKGAKGTPVTITRYPGGGKPSELVTTMVTFTKREFGGWSIRLASNGRLLGWTCPQHDGRDYAKVTGWSAHVSDSAFRGSGPDDEGHYMDRVPGWLFNESGKGGSASIATCRNRLEAAEEIVRKLHDRSAPALGYDRRYDVKRYDDPTCPGYKQKFATADGGPVCPVCGLGPDRLIQDRPRKRGDRWQGTVGYHLKRESVR